MNSRNSSLFYLALALLAMSSAIEAFDITKMLAKYPQLGLFSQYLSETKLADQINSRKTITVLAVDNSSLAAISGKPKDTIKAILSTHVVLDYFDEQKLMTTVNSKKTQLTTLFQTTGPSSNLLGFIKVGIVGEGELAFGPAANGAPLNAELVQTVTAQPYDISIMQVSQPIVAPGIDAQSPSSSPAPSAEAATPSSAPTGAPVASSPSLSPVAESPEESESPLPDSDGASDAAPAPASSSSSRIQMGLVWAVMMGFGALLVAM